MLWIIFQFLFQTVHHFNFKGKIDATLQISIPNEWETNIDAINIGYTAGIETDKVAPEWIQKGNEMNKIIVISNHSKNNYKNTTVKVKNQNDQTIDESYKLKTSIDVVGLPPKTAPVEKIQQLDLEYDYNFLCVSQWGPRKNFENTVKWWVEEFIDQEVGLIIKTSIANNCVIDSHKTEERLSQLLSTYPDRKCKVYLLHGDLTDGQMNYLYQHNKVKSIINISHGEGFGLPLIEAASNALPVITYNWSGHIDFLSHKGKKYFLEVSHELDKLKQHHIWPTVLVEDSKWAYVDQGSYKMKLREMKNQHRKYQKLAEKLQPIVQETFSSQRLYKQFCESIASAMPETKGYIEL